MRFKVDENLPLEVRVLLGAGFSAHTVDDEGLAGTEDGALAEICARESRILVTLDRGFADLRAFPPRQFAGLVVLRPGRQDKGTVIDIARRLVPLLEERHPSRELWVVDDARARIRRG